MADKLDELTPSRSWQSWELFLRYLRAREEREGDAEFHAMRQLMRADWDSTDTVRPI